MHKSNFELQEMYEDRSERRENVFKNNKTKYTMDPRMYYLLEADEDNNNRY